MKKYDLYKDSGIEWIGEIPNHWSALQLRIVVKSVKNGNTAEQIEESDFPISRIETISTGKINFEKVGFISQSDVRSDYILEKGDILLSHINSLEYLGNCAIYDSDKFLAHGMNLLRITPNERIITKLVTVHSILQNLQISKNKAV